MKAYIAAPMFSQAEKEFNLRVDAVARSLGLDTFLPQRDGGEAARLVRRGMDEHTVRQRLFDLDCAAIADCVLFVFVLDGRVPDEGACVELGMAFAHRKPCFGLQTDSRRFGGTDSNNLMIDYALTGGIAASLDELADNLRAHLRALAIR
ncbi:MAG: nucleoside 2-deoxyribosyltransferase [Pseudonocardiaceae bacterium]